MEDRRGESIWNRFCAETGHIIDGISGKPACDHYPCYKDDVDLMGEFGVNGLPFSMV